MSSSLHAFRIRLDADRIDLEGRYYAPDPLPQHQRHLYRVRGSIDEQRCELNVYASTSEEAKRIAEIEFRPKNAQVMGYHPLYDKALTLQKEMEPRNLIRAVNLDDIALRTRDIVSHLETVHENENWGTIDEALTFGELAESFAERVSSLRLALKLLVEAAKHAGNCAEAIDLRYIRKTGRRKNGLLPQPKEKQVP